MQGNREKIHSTKRLHGADVVRTVSAIGVVTYHYFSYLHLNNMNVYSLLYKHANGEWGYVFVTIFFILSGAMLYYSNGTNISYKQFYAKRWKSIYPMFWIAWAAFYILYVIKNRSLFYNGKPWQIMISIMGLDGYFSYKGWGSYYLLGEWFLGAIILL